MTVHPEQHRRSWREREAIAKMRKSKYAVDPEVKAARAAMMARVEAENAERARQETADREKPYERAAQLLGMLGDNLPELRDLLLSKVDVRALFEKLDRGALTVPVSPSRKGKAA